MDMSPNEHPLPEFEATFSTICEQLLHDVGHRLFTATRILSPELNERIYSTDPGAYPIHIPRPRDNSDWRSQMERGECFVANHPDQFGPHFGDLSTIVKRGLGAVINIPVLDDRGQMLGNLNLLDRAGAYGGPFVLERCQAVREQARQGFLQHARWVAQRTA
jgi:hypothetical protein